MRSCLSPSRPVRFHPSAPADLAARLHRRLRPFCERLEIAGPLRRHPGESGAGPDPPRIEFVAVPKLRLAERSGPWGRLAPRNLLHAAVLELLAAEEFWALEEGPDPAWLRYRLRSDQAEAILWMAAAGNFGSLWLWRTGSAAHTDWLCQRARARQACWLPRAGLCTGLRQLGACEQEIYAGLGLRFVPPACREPGCFEDGQFELPDEPIGHTQ